MILLPVVAREMSVLARRRSTYLWRAATPLLAVLVVGWLFLIAVAGVSFSKMGQTIFVVLSALSFLYALFVGAHSTTDCVSEEKREGTLGFLFLTDLKSYDIVLGKLAASSLNAVYALIGLVPMLSLALLLGGIAIAEVLKVFLVLANTMFFSLALGIFVSSISVHERKAIFSAVVVLALLAFGPFIVAAAMTDMQGFTAEIVWISPLYPYLCFVVPPGTLPKFHSGFLILSLVIQHLAAWFLLYRAMRVLPRFAHGAPQKFGAIKAGFETYVLGTRDQRKAHRAALLDRNAFLWLASRERVKPIWAWVIVGIFIVLHLWGVVGFGGILFDLHTTCAILLLFHLVMKIWVASEVCDRLIQDRRSGALELLLSSPLSVTEIVAGQGMALRRIFAKPLIALILIEIAFMFVPANDRGRVSFSTRAAAYFIGISSLLLDLWALKWVGLWLSLFGKSIERVLLGTIARILAVPSLTFLGLAAVLLAFGGFYGRLLSAGTVLWIWWTCGVLCSLGFAVPARRHFLKHFREVASNRYENASALASVVQRDAEKNQPKKGWAPARIFGRHPVFNTVVFAGVAVVLGVLGYRAYWEFRFEREVASIRSQNLPTRILEIPKLHPPVSRSENAFSMLQDSGAINRIVFTRMPSLNDENLRVGLSASARTNSQAFVTNNAAAVAAWQNLGSWTNAYYPPVMDYAYSSGPDLYGYLHVGMADLMLAFEDSDLERVEKDVLSTVRMIALARKQPLRYPQVCSLHAGVRLANLLEGIFFRDLLTEEMLIKIQKMGEEIAEENVLARQLAIDRVMVLDMPISMQRALMGASDPTVMRRRVMDAVGARQQQLTRLLGLYEEALAVAAKNEVERVAWALRLRRTDVSPEREPTLEEIGETLIAEAMLTDAQGIVQARLLQTAVAAQRYFRKHRTYPETLRALVPEFMAAVPTDPFSGKELAWKSHSSGAVLHRVEPGEQNDEVPRPPGYGDISFRFWIPDP